MNDNIIMAIGTPNLDSRYCYTKLACLFNLILTVPDGYGMFLTSPSERDDFYTIGSCDVQLTDVYIGSVHCHKVAFWKTDESYTAEIIVNDILCQARCESLLFGLSMHMSFPLVRDAINRRLGVPLFVFKKPYSIKYGTTKDVFDKTLWPLGSGQLLASGRMRPNFDFTLPLSKHNLKKHSMFLDAMTSNDVLGKYIRLYSFFDYISKNTGANFDKEVFTKLSNSGITEIRLVDGKIMNITTNLIKKLRKMRSDVAHRCREDSEMRLALYNHLVPIVEQIVENNSISIS